MKTYSVIELYAPLPEIAVSENTNFTSVIKRYNTEFTIYDLLPADYQGKIYGWSTHLDIISNRVVVFVLINPSCNFELLKHLYDEFTKLSQYGFVFDANNININQIEYERIFGGTEKGTTEFVFLENLDQPTHL